MKKMLVTAIAAAAFGAPALAADLPVKAPPIVYTTTTYSWSGCYLGGYIGGAWGARNVSAQDLNGYNYGGVAGPPFGYKLNSSVLGGGTLGCNYQTGQFVFGVEGEGGYLSLKGSSFDPNSPFLPLDTLASAKVGDWYGMITGRAGIAWDRTLFYVKGGLAFVNTSTSVVDANPANGNTITANGGNNTRAAWTVGAGIEYALSGAWSVKGEYMYIGLHQTDTDCGNAAVGGGRFCWSQNLPGIQTAKIGINYHFNAGPVVARY